MPTPRLTSLLVLLLAVPLLITAQPAPAQRDDPPPIIPDNAAALELQWQAGFGAVNALATREDTIFAATTGHTLTIEPPAQRLIIDHPGFTALDVLPLPGTEQTALALYTEYPRPAYYLGIADADGQRAALFRLPDDRNATPRTPRNLDMTLHTDAAGRWLVVNRVGFDTTLLDLQNRVIVGTVAGGAATLLPDGRMVMPTDNNLAHYAPGTLTVADTLDLGSGFDIRQLYVSPGGGWLGVATFDGLTLVLDADTLQPYRLLTMPGSGGPEIFNANGTRIIQSGDGALNVVHVEDGTLSTYAVSNRDELNRIRSIAAFANPALVAVAVDDRVRVVDLNAGDIITEDPSFTRHSTRAFSPDGQTLYAGTTAGQLRGYDITTGDIMLEIQQDTIPVSIATSAAALAAADGPRVMFYDPITGDDRGHVTVPEMQDAPDLPSFLLRQLRFSPDGRWLALSDVAGRVWVVDVPHVLELDAAPTEDSPIIRRVAAQAPGFVRNFFWASANDLVTISRDGDFMRFVITPTALQTVDINERGEFEVLGYNAAGGYGLLHDTTSPDGAVYAFDFVEERVLAQTILGAENPVRQATPGAFNTAGDVFALVAGWQLSILDASPPDTLLEALATVQPGDFGAVPLSGPGQPLFSPDGRYVVVAGADGSLRVYAVEVALLGS
jgi:WD40 repeat protein